jgi:hypothetical protein
MWARVTEVTANHIVTSTRYRIDIYNRFCCHPVTTSENVTQRFPSNRRYRPISISCNAQRKPVAGRDGVGEANDDAAYTGPTELGARRLKCGRGLYSVKSPPRARRKIMLSLVRRMDRESGERRCEGDYRKQEAPRKRAGRIRLAAGGPGGNGRGNSCSAEGPNGTDGSRTFTLPAQ